jgi:very-short-patch-repair endonuclease
MNTERNNKLLGMARTLRKNMTREEKHLWYDFLCGYPIRFRRQEIIGNYIADFFCAKARLVVELDGSQHYAEKNMQGDAARTAYFKGLGIDIIRFSNRDVERHFEGVCLSIEQKVRTLYPAGEWTHTRPEG